MGAIPELFFGQPVVSGRRRGDPGIPSVQGPDGQPLPYADEGGGRWVTIGAVQYAAAHAPPGGVDVQGKHYPGGQFIPSEVMAKASPAEKAAVSGTELPPAHAPQDTAGRPLPRTNPRRPQLDAPEPPPAAEVRPAPSPHPAAERPSAPQSTSGQPLRNVPPIAPGFVPDLSAPIKSTPGFTPEEAALERHAQEFVRANYPALRAQYLSEPQNARYDPQTGELASVTINTDEWRHLMPGYTGPNSGVVHNAASWANKQLRREMLETMKGRGNNTMLVMGGGGGSGKGTALAKLEEMGGADFPLILDQVTDDARELAGLQAQAAAPSPDGRPGMSNVYMFVDRNPVLALGGVVGRAVSSREKGKHARTVNLAHAAAANLHARAAAIQHIRANPDAGSRVWDGANGRLVPPSEQVPYLERRLAEDTATFRDDMQKLEMETALNARAGLPVGKKGGRIDPDIAEGLLGRDWWPRILRGDADTTQGPGY